MPYKSKAARREAYAKNPTRRAKASAATKKWRQEHPGHFTRWASGSTRRQKYMDDYRTKNAKKIKKRKNAWNRKNPAKVSVYCKKNYKEGGGRARQLERMLVKKYGITEARYAEMLVEQSGVCAICHRTAVSTKSGRRLSVDHCHRTKKVRGLLCRKCNSILGYAGDDLAVLLAAVDYLRRHS